jgi:Domain of unknown function (DUF6883)
MTLPNAHLAVVDEQKITEYLLNPAHPDNGGKARFFASLGFSSQQWEVFAAAARAVAQNGRMIRNSETAHGRKFVIEGEIQAPSGAKALVWSVWIIDQGTKKPRLVTAYPRG